MDSSTITVSEPGAGQGGQVDRVHTEIVEQVRRQATAAGESVEETFFRHWAELAAENGDCVDLHYLPALREGRGGWRIDGLAFDEERAELHVAVGSWHVGAAAETMSVDRLRTLMTGVNRFLERALDQDWLDALDKSDPALEAGTIINRAIALVGRIRLLVFTNATVGIRSRIGQTVLVGRPTTCSWVDLDRYLKITGAGARNEPIEIDVAALNEGRALACLEASSDSDDHRSYLLVMPALLLARIYADYGPRLLEQNVRTFLQARTKVNRGIIDTLRNEPDRFFAYNNGLTATASSVRIERGLDGLSGIVALQDLQIVNGGQTTASILYARDHRGASLEGVTVPVKLSVVPAERIDSFVPLVSRYANSQNRIREADLASGDTIHVELERISRQLPAPVHGDEPGSTKWFYERARGQYRDARSRLTGIDRHDFETEFPPGRVIQKTDLARYVMAFACRPDIVSRGAQKCFSHFSDAVREREAEGWTVDRAWYQEVIAMAIVFRWTDRHIGASDWYRAARGYKASTVAYTVSALQLGELHGKGHLIDCQAIWRLQDVPDELAHGVASLAPAIAERLRDLPPGEGNVGEHARKPACRKRILGELEPAQVALLPFHRGRS